MLETLLLVVGCLFNENDCKVLEKEPIEKQIDKDNELYFILDDLLNNL